MRHAVLGAAPYIRFVRGQPRLSGGFVAHREGRRRYGDLADVAAVPPRRAWRRVQYWTFADVARAVDRLAMDTLPLTYDVTVVAPAPMGWERPKTHGHVHIGPGGGGFPEVYEVIEGDGGFLVQDLHPGPTTRLAVLVTAAAGDQVVIPPGLHHVTINLGSAPLIVADAICRASQDDYTALRAAHGMAYFIGTNGTAHSNPAYVGGGPLRQVSAADWCKPLRASLYALLTESPSELSWLCSEEPLGAGVPTQPA